jgi:DNA-binding PadR family transcriptional regulator
VKSDPNADLLPGEWAVLGVIAQTPAHGFAIARELAPGGDLGKVWTMSRPRVYRAVSDLAARALIASTADESSDRGPTRVVYTATEAGTARLDRWLSTPVDHIRDVRSDLLLKLALLDRAGRSPRALLEAQRVRLGTLPGSLEAAEADADGFDAVVLRYRVSSARAVLEFVDELLAAAP